MSGAGIAGRLHGGLDRLLVPLENAAAVVSGLFTILAMVLTTVDALSRYLLNAPLVFQFYLTSNYLLVGLVLLALPWGFRTGGFIRVSMLTQHLPHWLTVTLLRTGLLASACYMALLGWRGGQYFWKAFQSQQIYIEDLNWPVSWSWFAIPIGCGLLTLRLLLVAAGPEADLHVEHDPEEEI